MTKVIVTGGTGFVAGWVIREFLTHDYFVATSVRSLKKGASIKTMLANQVTAEQLARLSFFEADLTNENGWVEGITGADGVIHVASPLGHGTETAEELITVAKGGVLNVLKAAKKAGVSRVVMTSSQAAATPDAGTTGILDERCWTNPNNPELDPYRQSKIASELAAWNYARAHDLQLSTILPGAIYGPILSKHAVSSDAILSRILKGMPFIPKVPMSISDVRDLAVLHRISFEQSAAIGHRYLAASQMLTMPEIAQFYHQNYPELVKHVRTLPNGLTKTLARFVPSLRALVPMLDRHYSYTTAAAEKQLGWIQHRPGDTVLDAAQSLIDFGIVKPSSHR